jgi:hypothetical protein
LRALYGLKEAPLLWYNAFKKTFMKLGLNPVNGFPCIFTNKWLIVFFYVDDVVMAYARANAHKHAEFEAALMECYNMKTMGDLHWYLGIRVMRDRGNRKIWLVQDAYIERVVKDFGIAPSARYTDVPMTVNQLEPSAKDSHPPRTKRYQQLVGHVAYLVQYTRPDLARTHSVYAAHLVNP